MIESVFLEKYKIEKKIGCGGFGIVYRACNLKTKRKVAIKVDSRQKGAVLCEAKVLSELQGEGIPKLYKHGTYQKCPYMICQLLGKNLASVHKKHDKSFSLGTAITIALQVLARLEHIHEKGFIHRDLKPQQLVLSQCKKKFFLIDFGLARRYIFKKQHVAYQSNCPRAGNATFSSLNNHMGIRQSRRDDIESWAYILVYLWKGYLPWQQTHKSNYAGKWDQSFIEKVSISVEQLCAGCPKQFIDIVNYSRNIDYEANPDYNYLRSTLEKIRDCLGFEPNYLEWNQIKPKRPTKKDTLKKESSETRIPRTKPKRTKKASTKITLPIPDFEYETYKKFSKSLGTKNCTTSASSLSRETNQVVYIVDNLSYCEVNFRTNLIEELESPCEDMSETPPYDPPEIKDRNILNFAKDENQPQTPVKNNCRMF